MQEVVSLYSNNSNVNHIDIVDALKGWAIFLVILTHSILVYPIDLYQYEFCHYIRLICSNIYMELFFIISGYCYSFKTTYQEFIIKKIKRLAVPYLIFCCIDMLFRFFSPNLVNKKLSLIESTSNMFLYGGAYWFLYTLFIIFAFYPLLEKLLNMSKIIKISLFLLLLYLSVFPLSFKLFRIHSITHYLFWFALGNNIKLLTKNNLPDNNYVMEFFSLITWFFILYFNYPQKQSNILMFIATILGIIFSYNFIQNNTLKKFFREFGKYSLQLYLLNGFFLVPSRYLWVNILKMQNPIMIIVLNTFVCFCISYLVIKNIFMKYKTTSFMMGQSYKYEKH